MPTDGGGEKIGEYAVITATALEKSSVYQEGFSPTFSAGFGITIGGGTIIDSIGNRGRYFNVGFTVGFDASMGLDFIKHKNINMAEFDISKTEGWGFMRECGISPWPIGPDVGNGGNQNSPNINIGLSLDPKDKTQYGNNYKSRNMGFSFGTPIGYTASSSYTWVWE